MNRREAIKRTALISGYALSASVLQGILQGCQPTQKNPLVDWEPNYFTKEQGMLVGNIAERILPKTDTPGAQDVFVHEYIDLIVGECFTAEDQGLFEDGLMEIDNTAQRAHGKIFVECDEDQQLEILNQMDVAAKELLEKEENLPEEKFPFILKIKQLTLAGYFTSEKIGTEVLSYDPIPGEHLGCIPVSDVGNAWTLN